MNAVIESLTKACKTDSGVLALINVDNFALFNDIYGMECGDKVIQKCIQVIDKVTEGDDIKASLGGDEFVVFAKNLKDKGELIAMTAYINEKLAYYITDLVGTDNTVSLGVSTGAVFVPEFGDSYEDLFHKADKALATAKQIGNHGCSFYEPSPRDREMVYDIGKITEKLDEDSELRGAMWLDSVYFGIVYRYIRRYLSTYGEDAAKMLITLDLTADNIGEEHFHQIVKEFGKVIVSALRRSDVVFQSRSNQFFLLLPKMNEEFIDKMSSRIKKKFREAGLDDVMDIDISYELIVSKKEDEM
ncbi:MAG: diguanylate cyclase [Eubacterium sp.]|nr:diguanylate cyclase [Eubacterium sp.]